MAGIRHLFWVISFIILCTITVTAYADVGIDPGEDPGLPGVVVGGSVRDPGRNSGSAAEAVSASVPGLTTYEYEWVLTCFDNYPGDQNEVCPSATNCSDGGQFRWSLWARQLTDGRGDPTPDSRWEIVATECYTNEPAVPAPPQPEVTDALVLREVQRLGLPRLMVQMQPADETLVNFETIFYTDAPQWARSIQLLGFAVDVEAQATGYDWQFGDGGSASTQSPGAPYPAKDVTHTYTDAHVTVAPRVDTAYEIRYRVDGGGWQTIAETVPAAGLPVDLRIREATAVLVGAN